MIAYPVKLDVLGSSRYVVELADGKIVASGGADLALKLEEQGYTWLEQGGIQLLNPDLQPGSHSRPVAE